MFDQCNYTCELAAGFFRPGGATLSMLEAGFPTCTCALISYKPIFDQEKCKVTWNSTQVTNQNHTVMTADEM